ncbi:MAG: tetratricopeptide repeat protein, partial [Bryobacteraceae bacterium]
HALSGSTFSINASAGGMRQRLERDGVEGEFPVDYVIGSGNNAFGYLVRIGNYLFQSPVAYYSKKKLWDLAPGYEGDRNPDFTRPVTMECLLCHSGKPSPLPETLNGYKQPAIETEGISCERCHGAVDAHLRTPSARNILNPKKLDARARDSVCEQCHLGGEARIPNPGRRIAEFTAGQRLEEVFSVYVFNNPTGGLKVVSHAEQLALSNCARKSGDKMWCGTCHNPHDKPENVASYYRAKCLNCHGDDLVKRHPAPSEDCVGCHMQRQTARDGGHTAFTDHRIRRPGTMLPSAEGGRTLAAWREPAAEFARRNLGLANITVGERDQSASDMDTGYRLLSDVYERSKKDAAVLTALGLVLLRKGQPVEAAHLYEEALRLQHAYAPYHINVAVAWNQAGDSAKAIAHLEKAIEMDPSLEAAYRRLADIYSNDKQPDKVRDTLRRYLKFNPNNVTVRIVLDQQ